MKKYVTISTILLGLFSLKAQQQATTNQQTQTTRTSEPQKKFKNPEFPGGLKAFRDEFVSKFRSQALQAARVKEAKATAVFLVEKDGSMSNFKIESTDNEAIKDEFLRALRKINTKWIPAEDNGIPVRTMLRQPLLFKTVK